MTRDETIAFVARRIELWNQHDAHALAADHADTGVVVSPMAGGTITGREDITKVYERLFQTFTDLTIEQDDLLIDGDRVALLASFTGTDRGGFMGLPPTNRTVHVPVAFFSHIVDGRIVHERRVYDYLGLLIQIGTLKAKPV